MADAEDRGDGERSGSDSDRVARLEEHLARIAAEVRAAGISIPPSWTYHIDAAELTPRQNEIARRMAQGQRVPAIARDLFLSPSTVRNHLSAIYRKLDVGSQSELIERLRHLGGARNSAPEEG